MCAGQGVAFRAIAPASSVNRVRAVASATGSPVQLQAEGSDANIDLLLAPAGAGYVRIGTHTASADAAITGFIIIKDAAGNLRKLAVIS